MFIFATIFATNTTAKQILYCVDDIVTGFKRSENVVTRYNEVRFPIEIDFENLSIKSEKIFLINPVCRNGYDSYHVLYCITRMGISFSFNKITNQFARSSVFINEKYDDSLYIAKGKCEKF